MKTYQKKKSHLAFIHTNKISADDDDDDDVEGVYEDGDDKGNEDRWGA